MKKLKFISTLASIALCVAVMVFGVMAASQVTFSITSTISYTVQDVFVDIETRVYSSSKLFGSDAEIGTAAQKMEVSNYETLNTTNPFTDGSTFNRVQLYNLDKGVDYEPVDPDYLYKFTGDSISKTPKSLELSLAYDTAVDNEAYSYFIVIKITNLSDLPVYAYLNSERYDAPENSYIYKLANFVELTTRGQSVYIVYAMGISDLTVDISDTFNVPIEINKNAPVTAPEATGVFSVADGESSPIGGEPISTTVVLSADATATTAADATRVLGSTIYIGSKQVSLTGIETEAEAIKVRFNNNQNTYIQLLDTMAYETILQGLSKKHAGVATIQGLVLNGQQIPGTLDAFYGATIDGSAVVWDYEQDRFRRDYATNNIEIPISALNNGSLNMVMLVMSTENVSSINLTISTQTVAEYENAKYELNEDGDSYTFKTYKNFYQVPLAVEIPSTYNSKPITKIGDSAFYYSMMLTSVSIPNSIEEISAFAFSTCQSLQNVVFAEGLLKIEKKAFEECPMLTTISLPNSVQVIEYDSFENSDNLQFYEENNFKFLGNSGNHNVYLYGPVSEMHASSYIVPSGCKIIGGDVFAYVESTLDLSMCTNLIYIQEPDTYRIGCDVLLPTANSNYIKDNNGIIYNKDKTLLLSCPVSLSATVEIPSTVTRIANSAFSNRDSVVIDFSSATNLEEVGRRAFEGCKKLQDVDLSACQNLLTIELGAFSYCPDLMSITLPKSVKTIDVGIAMGCDLLQGIYVDLQNPYFSNDEQGALYNKEKTELIIAPCVTNFVFLSSLVTIKKFALSGIQMTTVDLSNCENLTTIENNVFSYNCRISTLKLPSSITTIGEKLYFYTTYIYSIEIKKGTKLKVACSLPHIDEDEYVVGPEWYTTPTYDANSKVTEIPSTEFLEDTIYYAKW